MKYKPGDRINNWTIIKFSHMTNDMSNWLCRCDCGNEKIVTRQTLRDKSNYFCQKCYRANLCHAGETYGYWTLIQESYSSQQNSTQWICRCVCGKTKIVSQYSLRKGLSLSCGCRNKFDDLTNQVFGYLTVIQLDQRDSHPGNRWLCQCRCGKQTSVSTGSLNSGHTQSCGCYRLEQLRKAVTTHGLSGNSHYERARCRKRQEKKRHLDIQWSSLMEICIRDYFPNCVACGNNDRLAVDHVKPLSKGYGLSPSNAVVLCIKCNGIKADRELDQLPIEMATKIREAAESFRVAWSGGF